MPKIAELRPDLATGDVWVRLDRSYLEKDGPVSLYTEVEVEHLKRDVALAIIDQVNQLYPKPSA
jgi:hypothetical protein